MKFKGPSAAGLKYKSLDLLYNAIEPVELQIAI